MFKKQIHTLFLIFSMTTTALAQTLVLEGSIPDQYVGTNNNSYVHGAVVIDQASGMIDKIVTNPAEINSYKAQPNVTFLPLKRGEQWDVIYPGLIDLHNHTKQNNIGVWEHAHGQFANRFEWRDWSVYKKAVSNNMNPWIGYGKPVSCAAFRWSELQAMVVGTLYLQGPSSCIDNFAIHQVESSEAFPHSQKDRVQAPTDLVVPNEMVFIWKTLKPIIDTGKTYEEALAQTINEYCFAEKFNDKENRPLGRPFTAEDTLSDLGITLLKTKENLENFCNKKVPVEELPEKFVRYIYWVHKSVAGKKKYVEEIANGQGAAIIAHLSEGRADDAYNQKEYEVVKLLGMNRKGVNFVHGVGISEENLQDMANRQMGIIWSPFSNLLLYNQTLAVDKAIEKGVLVAMGSDWLPTGSKGPLEELKIAYQYIEANKLQEAVKKIPGADSVEEALYKMVTENPAKMINHWQNGADNSEWQNGEDQGGIGTLTAKAMGSVIVTSKIDSDNPYANLVKHVWESDINLVVVDGKVQYGNESYLNAAGLAFDPISDNDEHGVGKLAKDKDAPVLFEAKPNPSKDEEFDFLVQLSAYITNNAGSIGAEIKCQFSDRKGFVKQNTVSNDSDLLAFKEASGLDLDLFQDIQRLLGVSLVTQSRNRNDKEKGDPEFAVTEFTPLYTCNDDYHKTRVNDFISKTWPEDRTNRPESFSSKPESLAADYQ